MARRRKAAGLEIDVGLGLARVSEDVKELHRTLSGEFSKMEKGLSKALTFTGAVLGVGLLVGASNKLADAFGQLVAEGEKVGSVRDNFLALGGSVDSVERAKDATLGLVNAFDLMEIATKGLARGIPEFSTNLEQIAELGGRVGAAFGEDTKAGIERVSNALASVKSKQLEQIGVFQDQLKVLEEYRQAHGIYGRELSDIEKKEALRVDAISKLTEASERFFPVLDSVTNAHDAYKNKLGEVSKEIGIALNDTEELARVYRGLEAALESVDWQYVGDVASKALGRIIERLKNIYEYLTKIAGLRDSLEFITLENWVRGVDFILQLTDVSKLTKVVEEIQRLKNEIANFDEHAQHGISASDPAGLFTPQRDRDAMVAELERLERIREGYINHARQARVAEEQLAEARRNAGEAGRQAGEETGEALKKARIEAEKAAEEAKKLRKEWTDTVDALEEDILQEGIQLAIDKQDIQMFEKYITQLKVLLQKTLEEDVAKYVEAGIVRPEMAEKFRDLMVDRALTPLSEEYLQTGEEIIADLAEKQKEAFDNTIDFWESAFENAITGVTFSLSDALKRVAVGFAAQLATSVFGVFGGDISDLQGFGRALAQSFGFGTSEGGGGGFGLGAISGVGLAGVGDTLANVWANPSVFWEGLTGGMDVYSAPLGAEAAAQSGTMLADAGMVYGIMNAISEMSQIGQNTQETVEGIFTGGGAAIGSIWGPVGVAIGSTAGEIIGGIVGDLFEDSVHPERQARLDVESFLTKQLKASSAAGMPFQIFDAEGNMVPFEGFDFASFESMWKTPGWADTYEQNWDEDSRRTFQALGIALTEFLGVTEDVGGQIGVILQEALLGNLDNARLLLQSLGVSVDDLAAALMDMAKAGEISWQEWKTHVAGLSELSGEGLVAVGDLAGAYEQLSASGGAGMDSLIALQNMAIEALEAGITTVEEFGAALVEQGILSQEQWEEFANILAQHNIETMEQLAQAGENTLGSIVADLDTNIQLFEEWKEEIAGTAGEIEGLGEAWEDVPEKWKTDYVVNVVYHETGEPPEGVHDDFARQQFDMVTSGLTVAESGSGGSDFDFSFGDHRTPTGVGSLSRLARSFPVSGSGLNPIVVQYNVDARDASAGAETRIISALRTTQQLAAAQAVRQIRRHLRDL